MGGKVGIVPRDGALLTLAPSPEWFVFDLLRHADAGGVDRRTLVQNLAARVRSGRFDTDRLFDMAARFGGPDELAAVREATVGAAT